VTLSLVAADRATGEVGIAITSSSPAVAARCAHVRAGVGAVATQNVTDPRLGPALLDRLAAGASPEDALRALVAEQPPELIAFRQLTAVTPDGRTAIFSGDHALGVVGEHQGNAVVSAGNLLAARPSMGCPHGRAQRDVPGGKWRPNAQVFRTSLSR
jgi:uncharacterized Ntn-hydrolase superfamily protein